jgi:spore coat protein CotH
MNHPVFSRLTGLLLLLGSASLLSAQQGSLHSDPTVKDLGQPTRATEAVPVPAPQSPEIQLVRQFDRDGDGRLDAAERLAAREFLRLHPAPVTRPTTGRPGQATPQPLALEPLRPGEKFDATTAVNHASQSLYEPKAVRTLFLEFADADWEAELADFAPTDVSIPATLTVDGRKFAGVGVHARALRPADTLPAGYKRPLDIALDYTDAGQSLGGQRRLQLLSSSTDPTFLRTTLYGQIARTFLPAPRANFVRLVINGENWGIYVSVQPLDENFLQENYHTVRGACWTVTAGGNLAYLSESPESYRGAYHLQTAEEAGAWAKLAALCKLIELTEPGRLEEELSPHLDIDNALRFFALENALINLDGYGSATGGFGLYLDTGGKFHLIPQQAEASLRLVQVSEYSKGRRGSRPERAGPAAKTDGKAKDQPEDRALKAAQERKNFPRQSGTDLGMLLSYSFVNKADADFNGRVSRDEWESFARAWFFAMDEDQAGQLTRDQFITKVRLLVTPPSITDGRSRQTFGKDDAAALIGGDLFAAMHGDGPGPVTREEFTGTFSRWFTEWSDAKTKSLTQETLQTAFARLFTKTVFQADQSYIATRDGAKPGAEERGNGGREGRGGRGGGEGGEGGGVSTGLSLGPLRMGGLGGRGKDGTRTLVTFSEELDPLAGIDDATKPLLARLLAAPALRARYLNYVREIAENRLTWTWLGPVAKEYHELIAEDVRQDGHRATSYEQFVQEFDQNTNAGGRDGDAAPSLKNFIEERGDYLRKDDAVSGRGSW